MTPEVPHRAAAYFAKPALDAHHAEQAREVLDPVAAFAKQRGRAFEVHHCIGHSANEIAALARRERFELIVLGSHGHTALGGLVLGSVVSGMLARCSTPVLIVRHGATHAR